jgi:hypothetical protein
VKQLLIILAVILLSSGCKGPLSTPAAGKTGQGVHNVIVKEVIQVGTYTYLNVKEKRKETWIAVPAMQAAEGDKLSYSGGLEMTDFFSKELNRTFPSVLFLESVTMTTKKGENAMMSNTPSGTVKPEKIIVSIEAAEGGISIARLLETKADYSGKTVRVKGKVTKVNPEIMGKNWIHIQDGSEYNGEFDLTITTDVQPVVGDTVTFEGRITLKKDFGYGYFYDVLMEEGRLIK